MGYWRPEYLRRKLEKLRQAQRKDLLVAVSSNFNVREDDFTDVPRGGFFFKNKVQSKTSCASWTRSNSPPTRSRDPH